MRRRRRGKDAGGSAARREATSDAGEGGLLEGRSRFVLGVLGLAVLGFGGGWLLATRVVFPGPPPPGDLHEVPDVYGLLLEEAVGRLVEGGLALGTIDRFRHPSADSGVVVGQAPLPGQLARPGAAVRVSVSTGRERRPVPDVARMRGDRARTVLEAAGFQVTVDSVESDLPRGRVVRLEPEAGADLPLPGEVRVTVSTGPARIPMPLVLGMTEAAARDTLVAAGLVVSEVENVFRFGADQGRVVGQDPAAETVLERGSAVRLVVGRRGDEGDTIEAPAGVRPDTAGGAAPTPGSGPPGGNKSPRVP